MSQVERDEWAASVSVFRFKQLRDLRDLIVRAEQEQDDERRLEQVRRKAAELVADGWGGSTIRQLRKATRDELPLHREEIQSHVTRFENYYRELTKRHLDVEKAKTAIKDGMATAISTLEQARRHFIASRSPNEVKESGTDASESEYVFRQEGDKVWRLSYEGQTKHVRAQVGMKYLAELLSRPHVQVSPADLERVNAPADALPRGNAGFGDSRAELEELGEDLKRALAAQEKAYDEGDVALGAELASDIAALREAINDKTGLGGRPRRDSDQERARSSVTKAIKAAINKISSEFPQLGLHLGNCIKTGGTMSYEPDREIDWLV